jgi:hypothetical protein
MVPSAPFAAAAMLAAVVTLDVPHLQPLSDDPVIIGVADVARVTMLIVGLCLVAVATRQIIVAPRYVDTTMFISGFRWRTFAMCTGLLYVCTSAYDRIGQPVTIQFVLALLFVLAAFKAIVEAASLPRPQLRHEQALREYTPPSRREREA